MALKTVEWKDNSVIMIDQTKLPNVLEYVTFILKSWAVGD